MKLTLEEMYFLSRSDLSSREAAVRNILDRLPYMDDEELKEMAEQLVKKLEKMSDQEFHDLEIFEDEEDGNDE